MYGNLKVHSVQNSKIYYFHVPVIKIQTILLNKATIHEVSERLWVSYEAQCPQ